MKDIFFMLTWQNIFIVMQLVVIEGLLSFDNALALAALVRKKLKNEQQRKTALMLGIWGAYILRIGTLLIGVTIIKYEWVKAIAGLYLVYLCISELFFKHKDDISLEDMENKNENTDSTKSSMKVFAMTIVHVEIMDLMFSIDAIAVALAITDIPWVLISGALLGIFFMRIAAQFFIKIMEKFPILEKTAFVLVGIAGINVLLKLKDLNLGFTHLTIDKPMPEWLFLGLMASVIVISLFLNKKRTSKFV